MTLGPTIALMRLLEGARGALARWVSVFGRVPFFFYLLHIPLIHALALVVSKLRLGQAGAHVAVNYRTRATDAQDVCTQIARLGRRSVSVPANVSSAPEVARLVDTVQEQLGAVSLLINNAGISRPQPLEAITERDWDELLAVNLKSAFLVTQAVLLMRNGYVTGQTVNVSCLPILLFTHLAKRNRSGSRSVGHPLKKRRRRPPEAAQAVWNRKEPARRSLRYRPALGAPAPGPIFVVFRPGIWYSLPSRNNSSIGGNMSIRPVKRLIKSKPTLEGAGVHLRRAFGFGNTKDFDPFLLLDDFRNDVPEDYLAGFPWHPHRGIETITYVLAGTVEHGDSMGNRGAIAAGDVQWMTAGSGIIHQEMPKGDQAGRMHGFQLWANLPASLKMTAPRYQEVKALDIPEITDDDGTHVRVVCGSFWGKRGPVDGIAADPIYLDVSVSPGKRKTLPVETTRHAFAYVFAGSGKFCNASGPLAVPTEAVKWLDTAPPIEADNRSLILFDRGDEVIVQAGDDGIRFLLVSGKPLKEPVAWYGPIVMNTQEQLRQAFEELEQGTFLKRPR